MQHLQHLVKVLQTSSRKEMNLCSAGVKAILLAAV